MGGGAQGAHTLILWFWDDVPLGFANQQIKLEIYRTILEDSLSSFVGKAWENRLSCLAQESHLKCLARENHLRCLAFSV